ncbi:MAG: hypothetical protein J2P54_20095, partial [Bradyrhizobiaceae bacterium]|nr:hypothetical protein [Bradyrhizobiaceae bacterium]
EPSPDFKFFRGDCNVPHLTPGGHKVSGKGPRWKNPRRRRGGVIEHIAEDMIDHLQRLAVALKARQVNDPGSINCFSSTLRLVEGRQGVGDGIGVASGAVR